MNLYKFPDLSLGSLRSRMKRLERVVQFQKGGMNADGGAKYRTIAADNLDRDGNLTSTAITKALSK